LAQRFVNNFTLVDATTLPHMSYLFFPYVTPPTIPFQVSYEPTFSVRANTVGTVASVAFQLYQSNSPEEFLAENVLLLSQVDNQAPFLLGPAPQLSVPGKYLKCGDSFLFKNKQARL
jgi:hypothetical protein